MVLVYADEYRKANRLNTDFSSDLDSLCRRDYRRAFFNQEIPCLDIDEYERFCSGQNDCTMDAAIGIGTYDQNTVKDQRFLLVELRLGYTNANNLDYQNMSQKIDHTKDILSGSRIHPNYFSFSHRMCRQLQKLFQQKNAAVEKYCLLESDVTTGFSECH